MNTTIYTYNEDIHSTNIGITLIDQIKNFVYQ